VTAIHAVAGNRGASTVIDGSSSEPPSRRADVESQRLARILAALLAVLSRRGYSTTSLTKISSDSAPDGVALREPGAPILLYLAVLIGEAEALVLNGSTERLRKGNEMFCARLQLKLHVHRT